eukprot:TRINITY_DN45929_c0_g1_i1.p1 TRINITY_DN45929_c0_g1~~TRINITY_DN45929_c0_g1_i1.p1  ORF type:complete len:164 (+),score=10.73 TRINITY_DN45929_c0_g1_i1:82-573(+)
MNSSILHRFTQQFDFSENFFWSTVAALQCVAAILNGGVFGVLWQYVLNLYDTKKKRHGLFRDFSAGLIAGALLFFCGGVLFFGDFAPWISLCVCFLPTPLTAMLFGIMLTGKQKGYVEPYDNLDQQLLEMIADGIMHVNLLFVFVLAVVPGVLVELFVWWWRL